MVQDISKNPVIQKAGEIFFVFMLIKGLLMIN